jgi:hypothetical protein
MMGDDIFAAVSMIGIGVGAGRKLTNRTG